MPGTAVEGLHADHKRSKARRCSMSPVHRKTHPVSARRLSYEGLDLDPQMLAIAREHNPGIAFHQGDMVDFNLERQFDVITCLFSSIAYAGVAPKLEQAIATMARHLRPGGVLFVGPFFAPDAWVVGQPHAMFVDQPELKIARMNVSGRRDNIALLDFHYMVATPTASSISPSTMSWGCLQGQSLGMPSLPQGLM